MKKTIITTLVCIFAGLVLFAQPAPSSNPSTTSESKVVLANNETITGTITDNIRKKGEIIVEIAGKKAKYKAVDVSHVNTGTTNYISNNYTFYEVLFTGSELTVLRKACEPSGLHYNGSEAVVITSEGSIDDLFIKKKTGGLQLLTSRNASELLGPTCAAALYGNGKLDIESVKKALTNCNPSK